MVVSEVVRSPTIGEDRRQVVRLVVAVTDRSYGQSLRRGILRPITRSVMASATNRMIDRTTSRKVERQIGTVVGNRTTEHDVVRPVVPPIIRWHDQFSCTTNRVTGDPRSSTTGVATMHDWWYDHVRPICDRL